MNALKEISGSFLKENPCFQWVRSYPSIHCVYSYLRIPSIYLIRSKSTTRCSAMSHILPKLAFCFTSMPKVSDIIHTDSEWEDFDFNDELQTFTSDLQLETQISVSHHLSSNQQLLVENHASFLARHLDQLPAKYTSLDASRPWIIYWITHSLNLLKSFQDQTLESRYTSYWFSSIISTLNTLQNDTGGYGGGIGQESHLATTYAAVNSLAIIGSPAALDSIKRDALYKWFMSLKLNDGSFMMCRNGERDVRGCYCVVSIAKMLNLSTPELISGTPQFILEWLLDCLNLVKLTRVESVRCLVLKLMEDIPFVQ